MPPNDQSITLEDCRILFRNFKGEKQKFNEAGRRNFVVIISDELAAQLTEDGWNVKYLKPRPVDPGEDEHADAFLKVNVNYQGSRPPRIVLISSRGRTAISEDLAEMVDYVEIDKVDLIINPYHYEVQGETGITAYLKNMYITIVEDELDLKYAEIQDADEPLNIEAMRGQ